MVRSASRMVILAACLAIAVGAVQANSRSSSFGADAEAGRRLFIAKGCYECHGFAGQGAVGVGPRLAPPPLGAAAMESYVRRPTGTMPPYSARLLSSAELTAIRRYLTALPEGREPGQIPALAPYVASSASASVAPGSKALPLPGQGVYREHCAACHGANLEGGLGPDLRAAGQHYSAKQIAQIIRTPPAAMPRLYPGTLTAAQVNDAASFIANAAQTQR